MVKVEMVLSADTWHTTPHDFYSMEFLHQGESKIWYSIPSGSKDSFMEVMKTKLNGEVDDMKDRMVRAWTTGRRSKKIELNFLFFLPRFLIRLWPSLASP